MVRCNTVKRVAFGLALAMLVGAVPLQSGAAEPFVAVKCLCP